MTITNEARASVPYYHPSPEQLHFESICATVLAGLIADPAVESTTQCIPYAIDLAKDLITACRK